MAAARTTSPATVGAAEAAEAAVKRRRFRALATPLARHCGIGNGDRCVRKRASGKRASAAAQAS
eukprot:5600349-Prymnesium_polylepis.1